MNVSVSLSLRFFIILCLFFAIGATVDPVDPTVDSGAESNIAAAPQRKGKHLQLQVIKMRGGLLQRTKCTIYSR